MQHGESETASTPDARVVVRACSMGDLADLHLTATPAPGDERPIEQRAEALYGAVAEALREQGAHLFAERVFAGAGTFEALGAARRQAYGELDDGVAPTCLVAPGEGTPPLGVQVHALRGTPRPTVLGTDRPRGRRVADDERRWLFLGDLRGEPGGTPREEADDMFRSAERELAAAGDTFGAVARTWLWLGDICPWYDQLNDARTEFFRRSGLLAAARAGHCFPASTGIGIHPAAQDARACMDLIAVAGPPGTVRCHEVDGEQRSAYDYGSAFSRASTVRTPGGETVFVSGTAAIDDQGRTEYPDAIEPQIESTLAHVRALLAQHGCGDGSLLSALVYCKDEAVRRAYLETAAGRTWPALVLLGDVCRSDLTFEVEVTAARGATG